MIKINVKLNKLHITIKIKAVLVLLYLQKIVIITLPFSELSDWWLTNHYPSVP